MKAAQLIFQRIVVSSPSQLMCNKCGVVGATSLDWLMAEVELGGGNQACFVMCSESCQQDFVNDPRANEYIMDFLKRSRAFFSARVN